MRPDEGRLQTAEHILVHVLRTRFGAAAGVSRFHPDHGTLEVLSGTDMRKVDTAALSKEVEDVASRGYAVTRRTVGRDEAARVVSLARVPEDVKEVTIVGIEGYYASACRDPHVGNTKEIGAFRIEKVERVGDGRYRFRFSVA